MSVIDNRLESGAAHAALEAAARTFAEGPHRVDVTCDPGLDLPAGDVAALAEIAAVAVALTAARAFPDGRAGHVWIRLTRDGGRIKLSVSNDGMGAPEEAPEGFERIEALAARLGGFARVGARLFGGSEIAVVYRAGQDLPRA
ncbi:hypothetical protein [Phenylobacterium sp.]|uniref:hypothetical protein n=1 Tax=Phenylobacterium sp. TaxID=1871053 RepID=UPI00301D17AC